MLPAKVGDRSRHRSKAGVSDEHQCSYAQGNAGNTANPRNNTAVFETSTSLNHAGDLVLYTIRIVSGGTAGENLGKFRLSATTDNRSSFADGLSTGGDVTASWVELTPVSASATSATLTMNADRTIIASGTAVAGDTYTIQVLSSLASITGFRLEALTDALLPTTGPGRAANGNFQVQSLAIEQGGTLQLSDSSTVTLTSAAPSPALDIITVVPSALALPNGGFELAALPGNSFKFFSTMTPTEQAATVWTTGTPTTAGLTSNLSSFQSGIAAPEGIQHGVLNNDANLTQTISGFTVGAPYTVNLLTMARQLAPFGSDLEIVLDQGLPTELKILEIDEVIFNAFTRVASNTFFAIKDSYTLTIRSTQNGGALTGDRSTMIDDVRIVRQAAEGDVLTFSAANLLPQPTASGVILGNRTYLWTVASNNGQVIPNATSTVFSLRPARRFGVST